MSLPIEFQNDKFNITETPKGITIAIGRALTAFPEVQESIRQLMMVALKFMLTEDLERERRQDAEDRESDIREAVRSSMETRTDESAGDAASGDTEAHELEVPETVVRGSESRDDGEGAGESEAEES